MQGNKASALPLLATGTLVDHYKVIRLVGRGGMGEVYLARDTRLGRKVALKVVHPEGLGDEADTERFLREARLTAKFNHPHIVTIHGVGEHNGDPYVALEYLEGQTLRDRLSEERLGLKEALRIGLAVAEALREAHKRGVLHRDLKPENVFIPKDGRLRVLDFGLAKSVRARRPLPTRVPGRPGLKGSDWDEAEESVTLPEKTQPEADPDGAFGAEDSFVPGTRTSPEAAFDFADDFDAATAEHPTIRKVVETLGRGLRGTPAYMSPEQWSKEKLKPSTDVWALGLVLYEMISGHHPFRGAGFYKLCMEVCRPEPVASLGSMDELPGELVRLVDRCLEKEPGERPPIDLVVETLSGFLAGGSPRISEERSPFRGLLAFTERHADFFFGRGSEVTAFLEKLREEPILPVVGPSGAGKSSFVQAGVIPRLREQGNWTVLRMRPGNQPFLTLAARLLARESTNEKSSDSGGASGGLVGSDPGETTAVRRMSELHLADTLRESPTRLLLELGRLAETQRGRVLLFVDQLEELYTLVTKEDIRRTFMQALCTAVDDPEASVRVVFTLRDDFLGRLAEGTEAREVLGRVTVLRPPGIEALLEIVNRPVELVGYRYADPELVLDMVEAVRGEPAALPLLQFAGQMLWERRDRERRTLTRSAYTDIGGVEGALAQHADSVLAGLPPVQERVAREIFLRLVNLDGTRRVLPRSEVLEGLGGQAETVLEQLTAERAILVRKGREEAELELVHESMIQTWDRFARWLEESREERAFRTEASQAAELWEKRGRRDEEVWRAEALQDALRKSARCAALPDQVRRFLKAGEQRQRRSARLRWTVMTSGVVVLALIAAGSIAVSFALSRKEREAKRQKVIAENRRQQAELQRAEAQQEGARASLMRGDLIETRARLRSALETRDSPMARALWWRTKKTPLFWRKRLGGIVYAVAFSPDGQRVAAACHQNTVHLFDLWTGASRILRGHEHSVFAAGFSNDGRYLASGDRGGNVRVWELKTGANRVFAGHTAAVWDVSFGPKGHLLASGSDDYTVRIWNVETGRTIKVLKDHRSAVRGVRFSPDGALLASGSSDKTVRLWSVQTGRCVKVLLGHEGAVGGISFSPDGRKLASGGSDKDVRIWQVATGKTVRVLLGHEGGIWGVDFEPSGRRIASGGYDATIRIWDVETGEVRQVLKGHENMVWGLDFSPAGGRFLASAGEDKTVRVWDLRSAGKDAVRWKQPAGGSRPAGAGSGISPSAAGRAGPRSAAGGPGPPVSRAPLLRRSPVELCTDRGWIRLDGSGIPPKNGKRWRAATVRSLRASEANDGSLVCLWSEGKALELWDPSADKRLVRRHLPALATLLAVRGGCVTLAGGEAVLHDRTGNKRLLSNKANAVGFDGRHLLVAAGPRMHVLEPDGRQSATYAVNPGVTALTGAGHWLVVGFGDGNMELVPTGRLQKRPLVAFDGVPSSPVVRLLPGPMNTLIAGYVSGQVGLWSLENGGLLEHGRLQGPVSHLVLVKGKLYAASELGRHLFMDLGIFHTSYCDLMREIWSRVPVVWLGGEPVRRPKPKEHRCARGH